MRETPVSPKVDRAPAAFADHLDLMFGTRERAIKTPDDTQDHVEVWRHFEGGRRYFRKRFLESKMLGVNFRYWTRREFTLLNELQSERLHHVQEYWRIADLGLEGTQLETWDAGPDGDQWQQVPVARDGHRLAHPFLDCGHWFGLARWLLAALEEVHALGFVHVDLKGDNFCLPARSEGVAADGYPERVRLQWGELRLIDFAFSVWEDRARLPGHMPLPIGENAEFCYQSKQLLAALAAGNSPAPDLGPTRGLDWRADLYSLGFTLNQILAEVERHCFPEDRNWRWTGERAKRARWLIDDLQGWDKRWEQRKQAAPVERPHGALIADLDRLLGEGDLAGSLVSGWEIVRDPNWRPQDPGMRTPPTAPAPKRCQRNDALPPDALSGVQKLKAIAKKALSALIPQTEIDRCRVAAEQGDAAAQSNLGWRYANGRGVRQDDVEAVRWYRQAAEQGNAAAQFNLGWMYDNGRGVRQDDVEAVRWYRKAAEQGNAAAQNNLGWMYANGQGGLPKDDVEAVQWYRKAAEQGNARAQNNLGVMYRDGRGVRQDDAEAVQWYRKATEQGNAAAQTNLGWMYANGRGGLPKDEAKAVEWYRKAAAQGDADAQNSLGWMYANGRGGLPKDEAKAVEWYRKAAEQGNAAAQYNLGVRYETGRGGLPKDEAKAVEWYRKAAEQGNARAQTNLGWMYDNGRGGLPKDEAKAVEWYRKAAEQGNAAAQYNLGVMYANGRRGLPKDEAKAVEWYRKAAEQGDADARNNLRRLGR